MIESISAITLATHEMPRAVRFYRALGFEILHGGEDSSFTSFRAGPNYLNLIVQPPERRWSWWGRVIFYASDVDALHQRALAGGYRPSTSPRDAEWGERFFHIDAPDGHELSFARPLAPPDVIPASGAVICPEVSGSWPRAMRGFLLVPAAGTGRRAAELGRAGAAQRGRTVWIAIRIAVVRMQLHHPGCTVMGLDFRLGGCVCKCDRGERECRS